MKSDQSFIRSLLESQGAASSVASWLQGCGFDVMMRPASVRPSFEERVDYADSGDLEVRMRIEVKHRGIHFTCADDYPYDTVIVDECFKVERIDKNRLWGYVIINAAGTHACRIPAAAVFGGTVVKMFDKKDGQDREFVVCPKAKCRFYKMGE